MRRSRSRSRQQSLKFHRGKHGGARDGAGRKPNKGRRRVAHLRRAVVKSTSPVHVTVRVRKDMPRLRNFELAATLRQAFARGCAKTGFRICQFSIQGNHIHVICEASDRAALARGIQGWAVRVARGLNGKLERAGTVFDDRYHAEVIKMPRQMRNALCYVLQNARRHGVRIDRAWHGVDPFSSAWWFDGWRDDTWRHGLAPPEEPTVAQARSWLLTSAWRRYGLIGVTEAPAAASRSSR